MRVEAPLPRKNGRFMRGFCYSPETRIQAGERRSPGTEIKKGERLSPATEFQKGQAAHNKLPVGTVRMRIETNTRSPRAWIKVNDRSWQKRAVVVWEALNGPLPRGWVVHHKDRDTLNDDPSNLEGLNRRDHAEEHRDELNKSRRFGATL